MSRVIFPSHNGDFLPVNRVKPAQAGFSRPADTDVYSAGDVISSDVALGANGYLLFTLPTITGFLEGGIIVGAQIQSNAVNTPLPQLDLWLFDRLPDFSLNDNEPFAAPFDSLVDQYAFKISFPTPTAAANVVNTTVHQQMKELVRRFLPAEENSLLSGVLVVRNAYPPSSEEQFFATLDFAMC